MPFVRVMLRPNPFRLLVACALILSTTTSADTFISEIHYDNAGNDQNEAIEISTDLDTDLSSWSLVLYNGSNGNAYNTTTLSGPADADASCGDNGGTLVVNYSTNGIQNGSPDGVALVNGSEVVQFLSYEGSMIANDGPASGMTSTDIGERESSATAADESLQLVDGEWAPPAANSFGRCTTEVSGAGTPAPDGIFISEFHYDNSGADTGEAIELSGPAGASVSGWQIVLYNGSNGTVYDTRALNGELVAAAGCEEGSFVEIIAGIQNGAPDGIALVNANGAVVEFISYEGSLTAVGGPADGMTSTDVGVVETGSTAIGASLQRIDGVWAGPINNTFGSCAHPDTGPALVRIHAIQGSGDSVAISEVVSVEAVVVADYQSDMQLRGFFLQEEDADADSDPATSEGIFVFCSACATDVDVGDRVRVTGLPNDFFGMSQINATFDNDITVLASGAALPSPAVVSLPVTTTANDLAGANAEINAYYEAVEGMLVSFPSTLSVAEYFALARFGQVVLSADGRPRQFTDRDYPSAAGFTAHQMDLAARRIILDDDNNTQNHALFNDAPVFLPRPGFSVDNFFRGGDTITGLTGVLHWSWAGASGTDAWRVRPVPQIFDYRFTAQNSRSAAPTPVGGDLKVASFNVLNYFTTLDQGAPACGPDGLQNCRGANSTQELTRQTQKIVAAVCAIDADIVGLVELENPALGALDTPLSTLVSAINASCPTYAAIETGTVGTDVITVGIIYKPQTVDPTGQTAVLDDPAFTDPNATGSARNRAAIARSFKHLASERTLTVAVNHLKSKGSGCGAGDDDATTGQGNCNLTRTLAAQLQADWLTTNPTGVWNNDYVLVIGDLNAYRNEDPIAAFINAGYTDLIDFFNGPQAYSFVFDGQLGYLDHALANANLLPLITGVSNWRINADEVNLLDYNDAVQDGGEAPFEAKPSVLPLFAPGPYRSSDHDPLVVGITFPTTPLCHGREPTIYVDNGIIVGGPQDGARYQGSLTGGGGHDVILGTPGDDNINAGAGYDLICAMGGNDTVVAESGSDVVSGGAGNDLINGGSDNDVLYGDQGDDTLVGGAGADECYDGETLDCEK